MPDKQQGKWTDSCLGTERLHYLLSNFNEFEKYYLIFLSDSSSIGCQSTVV